MFIIKQKHILNALITSKGFTITGCQPNCFSFALPQEVSEQFHQIQNVIVRNNFCHEKNITHNQVDFSNSMFTIMHCGTTLNQDQCAFNITSHPQGYSFIHK